MRQWCGVGVIALILGSLGSVGAQGAPGAGSPGAPGAGSPGAPGAGSPGAPGAGSPSAPGAGSQGAPGAGSQGAPGAQGSRGSQQPARDTSARTPDTAPVPTGRITGRVVAADSGKPIKRARVLINAAELQGGRGV